MASFEAKSSGQTPERKELTSVELKEKLEYHYRQYDRRNVAPDPLQFPHRFKNQKDIELVAFLTSVYAFGNVKQISQAVEKMLELLGPSPVDFLISSTEQVIIERFSTVAHRFYKGQDSVTLMLIVREIYSEYGNLYELVKTLIPGGHQSTPFLVIGCFHKWFIRESERKGKLTRGLRFMIPDPEAGSSCKRFNLLLRWMVRKDDLDFGIWDFLSPAELIIPVDTHIAQIARFLGLTSRKNADWKMAEEITDHLREFDPVDPVKYDFSLCHIGIRGLEF